MRLSISDPSNRTHKPARRRLARRLLLTASTIAIAVAANDQRAVAGGPVGGSVVAGQASITSPNANSTLIKQSTQKAVINWQSFSISQGSSVQFAQPNASAIALNRVVGNTPSTINGNLFANGQVWLINGNGILFGKGSKINVGSLIASTADIRDSDFLSGNYSFGIPSTNPNASVVNQGSITTRTGGAAVLAGASVSNDGLINANLGQVALASGSTFSVDFAGDNLLRFAVASPVTQTPTDANGDPKAALVSNTGKISAPGGQVTMTARAANDVVDNVINNSGVVEATSASVHNGEVVLDAGDGTAQVSGTLDASASKSGETGGSVQVLGNTVQVADNTKINVSGPAGGGTVLIGGNFHGAGPQQNAQTTTVGKAIITADATQSGNGGNVAVWSNGQTNFAGSVSAKGGPGGGNGGQVETSGAHLNLDPAATVDTTAPKGQTGNWLLDPDTIIVESDDEDSTDLTNGSLALDTDSGETDFVDPLTITNALKTTDVTLEASDQIFVYDPLLYSSSTSLNLLSEGDVIVAASIQNSGTGAINLIAGWNGSEHNSAHFTDAGVFGNNEGRVSISADDDFDYPDLSESEAGEGETGNVAVGSASGTTTVAGSFVLVQASGGYSQIGYHHAGGGGGDINVVSSGDLTIGNDAGEGNYAQIGNGSVNGGVGGPVTGNISIKVAGTTNLNDNTDGEGAPVWIGNVAGNGFSESGNVTFITGDENGADLGPMLIADLGTSASTGGDVTVGQTTKDVHIGKPVVYSSPHAFNVLSTGNIDVKNAIQNSGTGDINLVAGWDGKTLDASKFTNAGVFGNSEGDVVIGGTNSENNSSVGSAGGTTTVEGHEIDVEADNGYAQIGYHGAGSGAINVNATSYLYVASGESSGDFAQIGNGAYVNAPSGNVSGDISINVGGTTEIDPRSGGAVWIGNATNANGSVASGNVTLITADVLNDGAFDSTYTLGNMLITDLGTSEATGSGGNVALGLRDPQNFFFNEALNVGAISYDSPHSLTLLATGAVALPFSIQNAGSGDLTLLAGWNSTVAPDQVLTTPLAFGQHGGFIELFGATGRSDEFDFNSGQGTAIGSKGGTTTVGGADVGVFAIDAYAQIGYHGGGATGAIDVIANGTPGTGEGSGAAACFNGNGDICVVGAYLAGEGGGDQPAYAQIGHLGQGVPGLASGAINVVATGNLSVVGGGNFVGEVDGDPQIANSYGQIGNGDASRLTDQGVSGNIFVSVDGGTYLASSAEPTSPAWIGNRTGVPANQSGNVIFITGTEDGDDLGPMLKEDIGGFPGGAGGDVTYGQTAGNIAIEDDVNYSSAHTFSILSTGDVDITGVVQNTGTGAINVVAGWDGTTTDTSQFTQAGVYGNNNGSVTIGGEGAVGSAGIGSFGGKTTIASGNVTVEGDNGSAQLGYNGYGGGDIEVDSTGFTDVTAGNGTIAQVGNGAYEASGGGKFTGNITINSQGNVAVSSGANAYAQIGNGGAGALGDVSGNITVTTPLEVSLTDAGSNSYAQIGNGGSQALDHTNPSGAVSGNIDVSSGQLVTLLSNSTNAAAHIGNGGFGTNDGNASGSASGNITVSGPTVNLFASAATGSAYIGNGGGLSGGNISGTINVSAQDAVGLDATSGGGTFIGNVGGTSAAESGAITVTTPGTISLVTDAGSSAYALIGDGSTYTSNAQSDNVTLSAHTITATPNTSGVFANALMLDVTGTNGSVGSATAPVGIDASSLAIDGDGANVFLNSVRSISIGAGGIGIALGSGDFSLTSSGDVTQTQSLSADNVTVSSTGGIALNNTANAATGTLSLTGANDVSFANSDATTLGASGGNHVTVSTSSGGINVNGTVNGTTNVALTSPGDITEGTSGAITGGGLNATSTSGGIALNSASNGVTGTVQLTAHNDAAFTNASAITLGISSANNIALNAITGGITLAGAVTANGGATFNAAGDITEGTNGSLSAQTLTATSSGGGITFNAPNNAVSGTVSLSGANDVSFRNTTATALGATSGNHVTVSTTTGGIAVNGTVNGTSNVSLTSPGDITEGTSGAITGGGLSATSTGGGIALGNAANAVTGPVQLSSHNNAAFENASAINLGASSAPNLTLTALSGGIALNGAVTATTLATLQAAGDITEGTGGTLSAPTLNATSTGGGIALTGTGNAVGTVSLSAHNAASFYDTTSVTLGTVTVSGDIALLSKGSISAPASIGTAGNLLLLAGWDGSTTNAAGFTNAGVYGNNGGNVTIGGSGATGNVAVGSTSATTTVEGAAVQVQAVNGYAMIGNHGAGTGAVVVNTTGNVSLTGGAGTNDFAQIGNGGQGISGNDSGAITITAGGDVVLAGGAGGEAYAQIGQGGAETNNGSSSGYTNDSAINVHATNATFNAGSGAGAYTQIGQGGFKAGENLAGGTGTNSGNVSVIVTHDVALNGGTGNDAYAQIGNGGDQSNLNATAAAHGSNTGNVTVTAPNGPSGSVTMHAGGGTDAYADIGNGGYAANSSSQAIPANFTFSGNISVTDLTIAGGSGGFAYSQIGNGDASGTGVGNVSGNIAIAANGNIVIIAGTGPHSGGGIGNVTGDGTTAGSVSGYVSPTNSALNGTINSLNSTGTNTPKTPSNTNTYIPPNNDNNDTTVYSAAFLTTNDKGDNSIATLTGGGDEDQTASDELTITVANSLTKSKSSNNQVVIIGLLKQFTPLGSNTPHGVPPADQEYSSWGNEAFWQ